MILFFVICNLMKSFQMLYKSHFEGSINISLLDFILFVCIILEHLENIQMESNL